MMFDDEPEPDHDREDGEAERKVFQVTGQESFDVEPFLGALADVLVEYARSKAKQSRSKTNSPNPR